MNKPIVILTGRVWSNAKVVTPESGKPFLDVTVKMAPRTWNGKTYFQKVYCRSYLQTAMAMAPQLLADTLVTVTGEADAVAEQGKDGKTYANVRVTGNVSLLDGESAPATQTATAPARAAEPAPVKAAAAQEDEENVPF